MSTPNLASPAVTPANPFGLRPLVQRKSDQFVTACAAAGQPIRITSGLRTFAEQDALYAKGRTAPGQIVTKAKAGQSLHNYGVAFDVCFRADGYPATSDPRWHQIAAIGATLGLEWGGSWPSFPDFPHFQLTLGHDWPEMLAKGAAFDWSPWN